MKTRILILGALVATAGASLVIESCGPGINLLTCNLKDSIADVDAFQLESGSIAAAQSIAIDSAGRIFVGGMARSSGTNKAMVRYSSDGGVSWSNGPAWTNGAASPSVLSIAVDDQDNVYAVVSLDASPQVQIAKSVDHGANWTTSAGYQFSAGNPTQGNSLAWHGGALYLAVQMSDGTTIFWGVLKSVDSGANWSVLDNFGPVTTTSYFPHSLFIRDNTILVVGQSQNVSDQPGWLSRFSTDLGQSWNAGEAVDGTASAQSGGRAAYVDPFGNFLAGGAAGASSNEAAVHRSADGQTWVGADSYPISGFFTEVEAVLPDLQGQLLAVGSGVDATGNNDQYWVRRSTDRGKTWSSLVSRTVVGTSQASLNGAAVAPNGTLFMVGANSSQTTQHWHVYKVGCD